MQFVYSQTARKISKPKIGKRADPIPKQPAQQVSHGYTERMCSLHSAFPFIENSENLTNYITGSVLR